MFLNKIFENLINWTILRGIKVAIILIVAIFLIKIFKVFISKFLVKFVENKAIQGKAKEEIDKERIATLKNVFISFLEITVWTITIITILPDFGVDIAPLLASVGVGGLALGFGARSLIQDYISGLFILLEDQYRVGEEVEIAGIKGKIKDFNLRRTVIITDDNAIHFVPNGQIKAVANLSRLEQK